MTPTRMTRIQVQLPQSLKRKLAALRTEGYSIAAYLRHLAELDIAERERSGWEAGKGWRGSHGRTALPSSPYPKWKHKKQDLPMAEYLEQISQEIAKRILGKRFESWQKRKEQTLARRQKGQ